jgi:heme-degrading monooxygenase HmoA
MILVANRIFVAPAHSAEFEHLFATRARLVDGMAGFIANQLLRPTAAGDPYLVHTLWESRDHFVAWTKSKEFVDGHARTDSLPQGTFTQHPKLEIHEVFQTTLWPGVAKGNGADAAR